MKTIFPGEKKKFHIVISLGYGFIIINIFIAASKTIKHHVAEIAETWCI